MRNWYTVASSFQGPGNASATWLDGGFRPPVDVDQAIGGPPPEKEPTMYIGGGALLIIIIILLIIIL